MKDSLFTRIINGEVPCHKVYEDDATLAFLDIHPAAEGHVLVVPKRQVEFVWDLSDNEYGALMHVVKKLALHLRTATGKSYVGSAIVGTDVPHAHVHLVPFDHSSEYYNIGRNDSEPDHTALAELATRLRLDSLEV